MEYKNIAPGDKTVTSEIIPFGTLNPAFNGYNQLQGSTLRFTKIQRDPSNGRPFSNLYPAFSLPAANFEVTGWDIDWGSNALKDIDTANTAIVVEFPKNTYGELIDGRTIRLKTQIWSGGSKTYITCYSSYYAGYNASSDPSVEAEVFGHTSAFNYVPPVPNPGVGDLSTNVAFLFSDQIKSPVNGGLWSTSYTLTQMPKGYQDGVVNAHDFDTNKVIAQATDAGDGVDEPIGICYLDKGFCVLTHPTLVNGFNYSATTQLATGGAYTGTSSAFTQVYFTDTTNSAEFFSFEKQWVLNVLCKAEANEFYLTQNTTAADLNPTVLTGPVMLPNTNELGAGTFYDLDSVQKPVYITEVALYDSDGTMLAIAKPDRPVQKNSSDPAYFNLKFRF
tara:strand:+ start:454 stop:1626 length:1173 start_codon:yes stop_codon:yes gene_type:complete